MTSHSEPTPDVTDEEADRLADLMFELMGVVLGRDAARKLADHLLALERGMPPDDAPATLTEETDQ